MARRRSTATPQVHGNGLSIGQLADLWNTTSDWVRLQLTAGRLDVNDTGRITTEAQGAFLRAHSDVFDARSAG